MLTNSILQLQAEGLADEYLSVDASMSSWKNKEEEERYAKYVSQDFELEFSNGERELELSPQVDLIHELFLVWPTRCTLHDSPGLPSGLNMNQFLLIAALVFPFTGGSPQEPSCCYDRFDHVTVSTGNEVIQSIDMESVRWYNKTRNVSDPRHYGAFGEYAVKIPFWFSRRRNLPLQQLCLYSTKMTISVGPHTYMRDLKVRVQGILLCEEERTSYPLNCHQSPITCLTRSHIVNPGVNLQLRHPTRALYFPINKMTGSTLELRFTRGGAPTRYSKGQLMVDSYRRANLHPCGKTGLILFDTADLNSYVPSGGTCNFSRLDFFSIDGLVPGTKVYQIYINVLCVGAGTAGLKYFAYYK